MLASTEARDALPKRLYVGGLTPSIAEKDLKERFSMFGTVQDVESVGVDGLGQPRNFAYLTIRSTPQNMKRCLNIMQGSTWRGAKLKIATAKPKFDIKLAAERPQLPSSTPALLPPALHRKLKLKERRDRKRKRVESDCDGYQCGDMRVVDIGTWREEGKTRQHWHVATTQPTQSPLLVRPALIRPTHPLPKPSYPSSKPPPAPSTSAKGKSASKKSVPKESNKEADKPKKVNTKPMKRARTIWIDPSRYGTYKGEEALAELSEAAAGEADNAVPSPNLDEWEWESDSTNSEDEEEPASRGGRWRNVSDPSKPDHHVPSKRRRLETVLQQIAETSSWPSEIQEIQTLPEKERAEKQERRRVRAEEDVVVSLGDDDIWGDMGASLPTREASPLFAALEPQAMESTGLFDEVPVSTEDAGLFDEPSSPAESVSSDSESESSAASSDVEQARHADAPMALESAGIFDSPPGSPVSSDSSITSSEDAPEDITCDPIASTTASRSSDSTTSDEGSDSADDDDDVMSMHEKEYASAAEFAEAERKRGWAVLQQLGFSHTDKPAFIEKESLVDLPGLAATAQPAERNDRSMQDQVEVLAAANPRVIGDAAPQEEASDKGDGAAKSTPAANGNHSNANGSASQQPDQSGTQDDGDVNMDGGSGGEDDSSSSDEEESDSNDSDDDDDSDSSSDSDSDSDSDTDSDSSSDSESSDSEEESEEKAAEAMTEKPRQSLKDMFAPKENSAPGFSLLGNLDLELDSDLEEDVLAPPVAGTSRQEVVEPLSFAPMPAVAGATFDGTLPLFFDYQPPAGTQPFARCETDEEMTAYWNAEKLNMTRDYKKRHREAVKKLKRGFAVARDDA